MILTFSQRRMEQRIISGIKRTTIRTDAHNRWKPGRYIHFWFRTDLTGKRLTFEVHTILL